MLSADFVILRLKIFSYCKLSCRTLRPWRGDAFSSSERGPGLVHQRCGVVTVEFYTWFASWHLNFPTVTNSRLPWQPVVPRNTNCAWVCRLRAVTREHSRNLTSPFPRSHLRFHGFPFKRWRRIFAGKWCLPCFHRVPKSLTCTALPVRLLVHTE